jgi:hypothetical protein
MSLLAVQAQPPKPMQPAAAVLVLAGLVPFALAWQANRRTSLRHAVLWAVAAWLGWGAALALGDTAAPGVEPGRYLALCLTGGAGVAVLGARRPHVGAWNFVVVGLLGVMLLPLAESLVIGTDPVDPLRIVFMAATAGVVVLNYLPTRAGPAAVLLGAGCAGEMVLLFAPGWIAPSAGWGFHLLILAVPWVGWLAWRRPRTEAAPFDRLWLDFRDRLGLLWGQRAREQFNHAAAHAGWPVQLRWRGLRRVGPGAISTEAQQEMVRTLRAVLKRFVPADEAGAEEAGPGPGAA